MTPRAHAHAACTDPAGLPKFVQAASSPGPMTKGSAARLMWFVSGISDPRRARPGGIVAGMSPEEE